MSISLQTDFEAENPGELSFKVSHVMWCAKENCWLNKFSMYIGEWCNTVSEQSGWKLVRRSNQWTHRLFPSLICELNRQTFNRHIVHVWDNQINFHPQLGKSPDPPILNSAGEHQLECMQCWTRHICCTVDELNYTQNTNKRILTTNSNYISDGSNKITHSSRNLCAFSPFI